jgi:hypothetical protein
MSATFGHAACGENVRAEIEEPGKGNPQEDDVGEAKFKCRWGRFLSGQLIVRYSIRENGREEEKHPSLYYELD